MRLWKLGRLWGRLKSFTAIEIDRKAAIVKRFFARVQNAHVLRSFETLIRYVLRLVYAVLRQRGGVLDHDMRNDVRVVLYLSRLDRRQV